MKREESADRNGNKTISAIVETKSSFTSHVHVETFYYGLLILSLESKFRYCQDSQDS